jgi:hypothetical protein
MDNNGNTVCASMNAQVWHVVVLERRKPMLLLLFVGVPLLRLATRTLAGLLFQDPPRNTRLEPLSAMPLKKSLT